MARVALSYILLVIVASCGASNIPGLRGFRHQRQSRDDEVSDVPTSRSPVMSSVDNNASIPPSLIRVLKLVKEATMVKSPALWIFLTNLG